MQLYVSGEKRMSNPIRILHVLGRLDRGGAETMVMNLYRHMDREQIQFDFVLHTTDECSYTEEVRMLGGRIYAVPAYSPATAGQYKKAWKTFFAEHQEYRILHSHVRSTASLYLPIARKNGLITIIHSHNTSSGKGVKALVKSILQYPLRFQADYLFACGREAGEWLFGKKACASKRFVLLPNAIDLTDFAFCEKTRQMVRKRLGVTDECTVIGHVGRMEEQKNHSFLLRVFEEIHRRIPDSVLLLIGEGPLQAELKEQAQKQPFGGAVQFLGSRKDISELLQGMDVFVFPSLYEGLPVTLVEAQAAGLAVVMSDTVTEEIVLTDLVECLNLNETIEDWTERILLQKDTHNSLERKSVDRMKQLKAAGYDIQETAGWLQRFYIGLIR